MITAFTRCFQVSCLCVWERMMGKKLKNHAFLGLETLEWQWWESGKEKVEGFNSRNEINNPSAEIMEVKIASYNSGMAHSLTYRLSWGYSALCIAVPDEDDCLFLVLPLTYWTCYIAVSFGKLLHYPEIMVTLQLHQ